MAVYDYECAYCGHKLNDVVQSIKAAPLFRCPECQTNALARVIYAPQVFIRGEATTIGQLSERNSKRLGKYEVQEKTAKDKDMKKDALKAAKKEMRSKINSMSESKKQRYIEDGRI